MIEGGKEKDISISTHMVKRISGGSVKSQDTKRAAERTGRCEEEGWTGVDGVEIGGLQFSTAPTAGLRTHSK